MTAISPSIHTPVDYDDSLHKYSWNGIPYTSATQVVEKFREKFDADERAVTYAAKNGGTPEQWKRIWKEKNQRSIQRGNGIHEREELILQSRMIDVRDGQVLPVHGELIADEIPWIDRPDGVYTERMLWHHGYRIAGRADKIALETPYSRELSRFRVAHIEDHKTNEKLDKESYQFKSGNRKMMKPPIAHLMDCNFVHYELQLSLYMLMLEYQGFRPGTITIWHYPHPTDENPMPEKEKYLVQYRKREIIHMLTYLNR